MKKILSYMTAGIMLLATSCSDDMFDGQLAEIPSDGQLEFRYSVPELQGIQTRALKENTVHTLTLLIFDGSGMLQQAEPLDPTKESCDVTIDKDLRKDKNLSFLMLANAPTTEDSNYDLNYFRSKINVSSKDDIKTLPTALHKVTDGDTDYLVMSGSASLNDILGFNSVDLYRSEAKVSVNKGVKDDDGNLKVDDEGKYELGDPIPFVTLGTDDDGSLFAGADSKNSNYILGNTPSSVTIPATFDSTEPVFVHPTKNLGGLDGAYVIVKNEFEGTTYYYRLDFEIDDYLNLNPNHWYQFVIKDVKGKGYTTTAEAAANPTPKSGGALEWTIRDHSPRVYNIVTDGKSSLGVSSSVSYTGNLTGDETATEYFYVRLSSKAGLEDLANAANELRIEKNKNWLTIGAIEEVPETGENLATESEPGKLYKVAAVFSRTSDVGSQTANITVKWRGLSRVVSVVWKRDFNAEDVVKNAKLQVYEGSNEKWSQNDYFQFLNTKVWGVEDEANNGDARNEGFHFPVMYGENTPWSYKYTVTFVNPDNQAYKWRIYISDNSDQVIKDKVKAIRTGDTTPLIKSTIINTTANQDGPTIELSMESGSDVSGVGTLMVEVAPSGTNDWKEMPIAIYHTGFFHKDNYDHAVAGTYDNAKPYTYYGVVKIGDYRWLDRNIGAHSAELYIEGADGTPQHGTTAGRGAYFYAAEQREKTPVLYSNLGIPPGYQVPYSTDWDALRKDSKFITTNLGAYTTAYYTTNSKKSDGSPLNIYFSKAMYYDGYNTDKVGEALAGYYWSQTTATGFEKEEMGRWVKCFVISGEATQLSNSRVDFAGAGSGFAMNLRCVSTHAEVQNDKEVNFFVRGATHVFAYSENEAGDRVVVARWPGTPIANYNTADVEYFNYRYTGTTSPDKLYLIFNFKGENGQIYSISKSGSSAIITTDVSPNNLEGWIASGAEAPNKSTSTSQVTGVNPVLKHDGSVDGTKYYWNINRSDATQITVTNTPGPQYVEPVITYQIHGKIFSNEWDTAGSKKVMTKQGSNWVATVKVNYTGAFIIQKLRNGSEADSYGHVSNESGDIALDTPKKCGGSTGQGDKNFNFGLDPGSYSFTYNPSNQTLTVSKKEKTEFEAGDKLQFRWTNGAKGIWVGYDEDGPYVDGLDWEASDTKTQDGSGYKYREIVFAQNAQKLKYKLKIGQNSDDFVSFDQAKSKYDSTVGAYIINLNNDGTIQ